MRFIRLKVKLNFYLPATSAGIFFCRNAGTTSRIEEKVMGKFSILIPFLLGWMDVQVVQSSLAAPALRQKRLFPASVAK